MRIDRETLSLHDALPILPVELELGAVGSIRGRAGGCTITLNWYVAVLVLGRSCRVQDRKSTRLNSSHVSISYAVFCLKKKKSSGKPLSSACSCRTHPLRG